MLSWFLLSLSLSTIHFCFPFFFTEVPQTLRFPEIWRAIKVLGQCAWSFLGSQGIHNPVKSRGCFQRQRIFFRKLVATSSNKFCPEDLVFFSVEDICIVSISRVSLKKEPRLFSLYLVLFVVRFWCSLLERLSGTQTIMDVLAFNCIFLSNSLRLWKCCEDWRVGELGSEMKDCYTISIQSFHDGEDQHKGGLGIHWQPGIQKVNDEKYHIPFLAWTNSDLNLDLNLAILGCLESSRSWSVCILYV